MIHAEFDAQRGYWRFVLRPNRSLSWRGTVHFFLGIATLSLAIATVLAIRGYWLVLPFAGLEIAALGAAFYVVARRSYQCEVIAVAEDILIERGVGRPRHRVRLPRAWAAVDVERCNASWYPSRLLIRSHGQAVEVGRFLPEGERLELALKLRRSLQQDQ